MLFILPFALALLFVIYQQRSTASSKQRRTINILLAAIFIAVYNLMVIGLVYFESMSGASLISGYNDGYWYSANVILTAGYGDLYPVTIYGRLLGLGFLLLSAVFYAFIIAIVIRLFLGVRLQRSL